LIILYFAKQQFNEVIRCIAWQFAKICGCTIYIFRQWTI